MESEIEYIHAKEFSSFPEKLRILLKRVTINENPNVVGSTAYSEHKYPGDVDVFEKVSVNLSYEDARLFLESQFINIAQKISVNSSSYIFSDFKAGEDDIYDRDISWLYNNDLITDKEYNDIIEGKEKEEDIINNLKVLRWSLEELIIGEKKLRGNRSILLHEAISQPHIVKLDVICHIEDRFVSVEVFYSLQYMSNNKYVSFYLIDSYVSSLLQDIQKYKYSSPLKVLKRLWSLSRLISCEGYIKAINPILSSNVAALSQINSDIEVLLIILNKELVSDKHIRNVFLEILGFQKRLSNHTKWTNLNKIQEILENIYDEWKYYKLYSQVNKKSIKTKLNDIYYFLSDEIYKNSKKYLSIVNNMDIIC